MEPLLEHPFRLEYPFQLEHPSFQLEPLQRRQHRNRMVPVLVLEHRNHMGLELELDCSSCHRDLHEDAATSLDGKDRQECLP